MSQQDIIEVRRLRKARDGKIFRTSALLVRIDKIDSLCARAPFINPFLAKRHSSRQEIPLVGGFGCLEHGRAGVATS